MEPLEAVNQHAAVFLVQNVLPHRDDQIRSDPDENLFKGGVVKLANRQAVGDHRGSNRRIREDFENGRHYALSTGNR